MLFVGRLEYYTFDKSPAILDIMADGRFRGQVKIPCTPGREYDYEELKSFVRVLRPSLGGKDFDLFPCGKPTFRDL